MLQGGIALKIVESLPQWVRSTQPARHSDGPSAHRHMEPNFSRGQPRWIVRMWKDHTRAHTTPEFVLLGTPLRDLKLTRERDIWPFAQLNTGSIGYRGATKGELYVSGSR